MKELAQAWMASLQNMGVDSISLTVHKQKNRAMFFLPIPPETKAENQRQGVGNRPLHDCLVCTIRDMDFHCLKSSWMSGTAGL